MRLRLLFIAAISIFLLAGCGVRGSLKTPPPLWGGNDKVRVEETEPESTEPTSTEPADIEDDEDDNYLEGPY